MFFEDWHKLLKIAITCAAVYPALVILLRISGKRTLAKWNAFDFISTIALGSIFATVILSKDVPVMEGLTALSILILLQFAITWISVRVQWFENLIKAKPSLLFLNGEFLRGEMRVTRVSMAEVLSAIRASSVGDLDAVEAVVLETDGSFSVIKKTEGTKKHSSLMDVEGY